MDAPDGVQPKDLALVLCRQAMKASVRVSGARRVGTGGQGDRKSGVQYWHSDALLTAKAKRVSRESCVGSQSGQMRSRWLLIKSLLAGVRRRVCQAG